ALTCDAVGPVPCERPDASEELLDRRLLAGARQRDELCVIHVPTIRPWDGANFPSPVGSRVLTCRAAMRLLPGSVAAPGSTTRSRGGCPMPGRACSSTVGRRPIRPSVG